MFLMDETKKPTPSAEELASELKNSPELEWYKNQRVTFERLDEIVAELDKKLSESDLDEKDKGVLRRNVVGPINEIKRATHEYYEIIVRTQQSLESNRFRVEPWEYKELAEKYDGRRKIVHDQMIASIIALTRWIRTKVKQAGIEIELEPKWFTQEELMDRDQIGEWAYNAARAEKTLEKIRESGAQ